MEKLGQIKIFLVVVLCLQFCSAENVSSTTTPSSIGNVTTVNYGEVDLEALRAFGVSEEFAEQFRLNLIKAIEAEREVEGQPPPLRQGEFGGVNGGFYQGGPGSGGSGGGGGGPGGEEDEDEEDDGSMMPATPGPGAFGVLSGLFGIFSGLGSLNPSRIIQSTVNFFPPSQRMQAQMIVDSLIGYTPPDNRTARPRPRTRSTTTTVVPALLPVSEMISHAPSAAGMLMENTNGVPAKDGENILTSSSGNGTAAPMSEIGGPGVIPVVTEATTTQAEPDFINVHELLQRTTIPPPPQNEDDEEEVEKRFSLEKLKPKPSISSSPSNTGPYKLKAKSPEVVEGHQESVIVDAPNNNSTTAATTKNT